MERLSARIDQRAVWTDFRGLRKARRLGAPSRQDVEHLLTGSEQVISNNTAMTSPPHRLRTHNGTALLPAQSPQLANTVLEGTGHRVVRVVVKACILPKSIQVLRNV